MRDIFEDIAGMQKNIEPLNINGLKGRLLRIPSESKKNTREILMVYGHHSNLERMYGVAEMFATCGNVTMPDLPGFGGMDSFYSIGMKPDLDTMADYLATFVKLKYRRKKVTIVGMSYGFIVATRMLQRYPDLVSKVDFVVSLVGFSHKSDFLISRNWMTFYRVSARILRSRPVSFVFYNIGLHPVTLRLLYRHMHNAKHKFEGLDAEELKQMTEFEVILGRTNEVRTYARTASTMFNVDNCTRQIDLPVHHVHVKDDQYLDNSVVEQHMRVIFNDFIGYPVDVKVHAPSIVASKKEAAPFFPKKLKKMLSS